MFRKTITRLAYSPALAGEAAAYAKRLRREEAKRQIGLIFIGLALVVQSFAVIFPPESANAGNSSDYIEGGFSTIAEYLKYYDRNTRNIRDLLASLGISRADIQATQSAGLEETKDLLLWKMSSRGDGGDMAYDFLSSDNTTQTAYYQFLNLKDPSLRLTSSEMNHAAFVGHSSSIEWFAILKNSGNIVTTDILSGECASESDSPVSEPLVISLTDANRCGVRLTQTHSASNLTTGMPVITKNTQASDRIMYTLGVNNSDSRTVSTSLSLGLGDILEYAQLIDKGGASFDNETKNLTWPSAIIPGGTTLTRSFIVKLLPAIPSTATGQNNPSSDDCLLTSSFGQTLRIPVACPFPKVIEQTVNKLPSASAQLNTVFAVAVALIAAYFYVRARQLQTELRLIRHSYHGSL